MDFEDEYMDETSDEWVPDRDTLKGGSGRYIVQGLFIETNWDDEVAVYSLSGEDKVRGDKVFPSLKRLYLDMADVKEYSFAKKYLFDWPHWQRLCKNKLVGEHIRSWREELELMLESEAQMQMLALADEGSYQAVKYVADKGWSTKKRGRPTKDETEEELKKRADEEASFNEDFKLLTIK